MTTSPPGTSTGAGTSGGRDAGAPVAASSAAVWSALWVVYLVWGSTYLAIAVVIESMPPLLSLGARFLLATALLALFLAVRRGPRSLVVPWAEIRGAAVVGVLLLVCGIGFLTLAERYVPTGVAALLVAVVPMWVVLLRVGSGDRPHRVTWVGVLVGLAGVAVLVLPGEHVASVGGATAAQRALWSGLIVLGSICWAVGSFLQPRLRTPRDQLVLTTYEMLAGGVVLCLLGLARGERLGDFAEATTRSWIGLAYLVTFGSLLAYTAFVWLVTHAPLSLVTTYAYVNPVVAVALGFLVLGEQLTPGILLGGAVVVVGVVLVVSGERRSAPPSLAEPAAAP
jgi:drug/metabolite transporter (DMT)-like permease